MQGDEESPVRVVLRALRPPPEGARLESWRALLCPEEIARLERIRATRARMEVLASRALLRKELGRVAGVDPRDWRFSPSAEGRPAVVEPAGMRGEWWFSLSHTDGLVGCAIARHEEIGLDLEPVDRRVDVAQLAGRFFSMQEAARLRTMPDGEKRRAFLRLWTLKEAYFKARGLGLAAGLERARFSIEPHGVEFEVDAGLDSPEGWEFRSYETPTGHWVAVASRKGGENS